jgi:hypothetical protein
MSQADSNTLCRTAGVHSKEDVHTVNQTEAEILEATQRGDWKQLENYKHNNCFKLVGFDCYLDTNVGTLLLWIVLTTCRDTETAMWLINECAADVYVVITNRRILTTALRVSDYQLIMFVASLCASDINHLITVDALETRGAAHARHIICIALVERDIMYVQLMVCVLRALCGSSHQLHFTKVFRTRRVLPAALSNTDALKWACLYGWPDVIKLLLYIHPLPDTHYQSYIFLAMQGEDPISSLGVILDHGPNLCISNEVIVRDVDHNSPLQLAIKLRNTEMVAMLMNSMLPEDQTTLCSLNLQLDLRGNGPGARIEDNNRTLTVAILDTFQLGGHDTPSAELIVALPGGVVPFRLNSRRETYYLESIPE